MNATADSFVLTGAHVIDPEQELDRIADVHVVDGKVHAIGDRVVPGDAKRIDVSGHYVTPGWIDLHVHAYGTLGFSDPDKVGIHQGVTTFVDAGGAGIGVLDQFMALLDGLETSLYCGALIRPFGLLGLSFHEGDVRSLGNVPITEWVDFAKEHRDMLRYIKCNAVGDYGPGTLKLTKGLAEILNLPLYQHIGEFQLQTPEHNLTPDAFETSDRGDMITHIYHGNLGHILDDGGKVHGFVRDAERRGVLFDLGFGSYNFSWNIAEKAFAQDLVPHIISSDLQQFNVIRPVKSLANVMSAMMKLGMDLHQIIQRVTAAPAKALSLTDRAGALKPGMPADITVFRLESGQFELPDCLAQIRIGETRFVPAITFKNGKRFDADLALAQDESNWFLQFAEDHVPVGAAALSGRQRTFLAALVDKLSNVKWEIATPQHVEIESAIRLQDIFHEIRQAQDLPLKDALRAVYSCFMDNHFTAQIGLLFLRLDQAFALRRMREVAGERMAA